MGRSGDVGHLWGEVEMWDAYEEKWICGTLMRRSGDVGHLWGEVEMWDAYGEK